MDLIKIFNTIWHPLSEFLLDYYNWYIVIFIYSFICYLYSQFAWSFMSLELRKRKEIIQDIHLYKTTHPNELYPKALEDKMKSIFHKNQPLYPEGYFLALEELIKKRKGHPLLTLLFIFMQYVLFASIMGYLMNGNSMLPNNDVYYYLSIGLMILRILNRRFLVLKLIFLVISFFVYKYLTTDALLFITYISVFGFIKFIFKKITNKRTA